MSAITTVKGIPYQLGTDFSDPRSFRDLAVAADTAYSAYDLAFQAGPRPPSFLTRATLDASAFSNGIGFAMNAAVVDWNNSTGTINSSGVFTQDPNEVQSWWMFGSMVITSIASGTATAGTALEAAYLVTSVDPVTGLAASLALGDGAQFQSNTSSQVTYTTQMTETNTAGEFLLGHVIVPLYKGKVTPLFGNRDTGTQTKKSIAGTVFWGVRLGAV